MTGFVSTFLTHDGGKPLTFGIVADCRESDIAALDFRTLVRLAQLNSNACAYGKIVVVGREGISTFQATADGVAEPVFCGNSTAAAIGFQGATGSVRTRVRGVAANPYEVSAHIEGGKVAQTWMVPASAAEEKLWRGCRVVFLPALNDYALVFGRLPRGIAPEAARRELLGTGPACKLAVIGGATGTPEVAFYNSNGRHGAAPQTGLATISLAARSVPWVGNLLAGGCVTYRTQTGVRRTDLPVAQANASGMIAVEMPTVAVDLAPITLEQVA